MKLKEIRTEIDILIDDDSYDAIAVDGYINQTLAYVAGLIDLPSLKRIGTVTTVTGQAYANILDEVSDFSISRLKRVKTSEGGSPDVYASLWAMMDNYPTMDEEGDVEAVAVEGNRLWYQKIPEAAETLVIGYMIEPSRLVLDDDEPDDIPDYLQRALLVHGTAWIIMDQKEEHIDSQKFNTKSHFWLSFDENNKSSGIVHLRSWVSRSRKNYSYGIWRY